MDNEEFETKKDIEIIIPPEAEDKAEKFIENDDAKDHMKAIDEIEKYVKTTDDTKEHMKHRKSIDYIFVSQYMYDTDNEEYDPTLDAYVVTFSKNDNSILGWRVNVEKGEQPPDNVYFQHDRLKELDKIESFILFYIPIEFITLKNGFEGLIIKSGSDKKYRLIDPYQLFDTIETNESIDDKNVITQLNRKVSIRNNNVCITDITGLDENLVQQTKTSFYTLSTFIFIQKMLKDIIKEVIKDVPKSEIEIKDGTRVVLESNHIIKIEHNGVTSVYKTNSYILSLNLLYNQYLVQIDTSGIRILNDFGKPTLSCRYYWYNDEWNEKFENSLNNKNDIKFINDYIPFIKKVLANEFNDSKSSIPCSRFFVSRKQIDTFRYDFKGIINDTLALSKFGSEILNIAINDRNDDIVQHILDQTFESIKNNHNYMASLPFVSLNLPKLCNYPDFLIKFITRTSFLLSPACNAIKRSTNTSLYSHLSIRIKKPSLGNDYFKSISSFFKSLIQNLRIQEEVQTISFIVPFPQICVYQNHKNHKTENKHTKSSRGIKNNDDETENNQDTKKKKITRPKIIIVPKMAQIIFGMNFYINKNLFSFVI
ncbi:hypothetical protein RhiirB3_415813 [Rhizophagus irregularis]|nr:hypothetical protein RhiirB3_415813 [Rhizophagus irregularis]